MPRRFLLPALAVLALPLAAAEPAWLARAWQSDDGLPNADVWWLCEDHEGSVWAATAGGGACRVRPRVLTMFDEAGGPRGEIARALCTDARGDI